MPYQSRNDEHNALHLPDLAGNGYQYWHEPFGDVGIWNGQFEQGPDTAPEGWEVYTYAGGSVTRTTGGLSGNYCMVGGQAGAGAGGYILSLRYIPVDLNTNYFLSAAFVGATANSRVSLGVECYTAAKVYIARATVVTNATPGVAWLRYHRRVGPAGDVAFPANTRYIRVIADLQNNAALNNDWAYVDDIQFQQAKPSQSATMSPGYNAVVSAVAQTFNTSAWVQWGSSIMTITTTEPSQIWAWYDVSAFANTVRTYSFGVYIYLNGGQAYHTMRVGEAVANTYIPIHIGGFLPLVAAAGVQTIDLRFYVINAGDVVTAALVIGSCLWFRRY
jgi:hypothetical protein